MGKLTKKDDQGNWCLRGISWKQLHIGQLITHEVSDKLYEALWKLMQYEDTGLEPDGFIMKGKVNFQLLFNDFDENYNTYRKFITEKNWCAANNHENYLLGVLKSMIFLYTDDMGEIIYSQIYERANLLGLKLGLE